jgi:cell division protein FtsL
LPKVNKELALKLIEEEEEKQKSAWKKKVKVRVPKVEKILLSYFYIFWVVIVLSFFFFFTLKVLYGRSEGRRSSSCTLQTPVQKEKKKNPEGLLFVLFLGFGVFLFLACLLVR